MPAIGVVGLLGLADEGIAGAKPYRDSIAGEILGLDPGEIIAKSRKLGVDSLYAASKDCTGIV